MTHPLPLSPGPAQVLKTDMVLGRSESARFKREFNKADFSRDGELTTADAVRAFRGLSGKATENEVCVFGGESVQHSPELGTGARTP